MKSTKKGDIELTKARGHLQQRGLYICNDCNHDWRAKSAKVCPACRSKNIREQ